MAFNLPYELKYFNVWRIHANKFIQAIDSFTVTVFKDGELYTGLLYDENEKQISNPFGVTGKSSFYVAVEDGSNYTLEAVSNGAKFWRKDTQSLYVAGALQDIAQLAAEALQAAEDAAASESNAADSAQTAALSESNASDSAQAAVDAAASVIADRENIDTLKRDRVVDVTQNGVRDSYEYPPLVIDPAGYGAGSILEGGRMALGGVNIHTPLLRDEYEDLRPLLSTPGGAVLSGDRNGRIAAAGIRLFKSGTKQARDAFPDNAFPLFEFDNGATAEQLGDGSIRLEVRSRARGVGVRDAMGALRDGFVDVEGFANIAAHEDGRVVVALHDDSLKYLTSAPWATIPSSIPYISDGSAYLWTEGTSHDMRILTEDELTSIHTVGVTSTQFYALAAAPEGTRQIMFDLAPTNALLSGVDMVWHIPLYGQSNGVGTNSDDLVDPGPLNPGRVVSFDDRVRVGSALPNARTSRDNLAGFTDLRERNNGALRRTYASTMGAGLTPYLPGNVGLNFAATGVGGTTNAQREKGTAPYRNLLLCVERAATIARLSGQACIVPFYITIDGENDGSMAKAVFMGVKQTERDNIDADVKLVTGQEQDVICVTDQQSYQVQPSALAQLQLAQDDPEHFICLGGKYHLAYGDHIHINGPSTARRGYELARAVRRKLIDEVDPLPLHVTSAIRTGDTIVLTWGGDIEGDVVIDTDLVTDPGDNGVAFSQTGGNSVTIVGVTQTGSRETTVVLSDTPTGTGQTIKIARHPNVSLGGPEDGCRSNFRDESPDTCTYDGTTYPMYRWAAHQEIPIT